MHSPVGNRVLAILRDGDYAHPKEGTAVAEALTAVQRAEVRRVLDAGCGRGGTANLLSQHDWGTVVGLDIDGESIEYATRTCAEVGLFALDVKQAGQLPEEPFDLVCCFNAYCAFPDQPAALRSLHQVCRPGARLVLFNCCRFAHQQLPAALGEEIGRPVEFAVFSDRLGQTGWKLLEIQNITDHYVAWYERLLRRLSINRSAIIAVAGEEMCQYVDRWYGALHCGLMARTIGGALITAVAN